LNTARRPNFLFLLPDQLRHDWLGCAGSEPVRTPHFDALARRGVRFLNAYTPSPLCAPARACLASEREYSACGVPDNRHDYPLDQPTFYAHLRDAGYHVMGCGKFDLHKSAPIWGEDGQACLHEWGFSAGIDNAGKWDAILSGEHSARDPYMAHLHAHGWAQQHAQDFHARKGTLSTHATPLPDEAYCDNWIGANARHLLESAPCDAPWFLMVNFTGPHEPFDVTAEMHRLYREPPVQFSSPQETDDRFDNEHHQEIRRNYAAMIENIDRRCGEIFEAVKARGEWENTFVVLASDHGEMLGEKGRWGKSVPWEAATRIPLVCAGPGVLSDRESAALVSLIDVGATFLDYAAAAPLPHAQSRSLRPLLEGRAQSHRDFVRSDLSAWRAVRDERWKLIAGWPKADSAPLLFDLQSDPHETRDMSAGHPEIVARLRTACA
jgi:choline-sulfatase